MATIAVAVFYCFLFFLSLFIINHLIKPFTQTCINPPSPLGLPIIGHLYLLKSSVLTKTFQSLALRYGPLMQLRLGASTCVVASDTAVAKEIFKTQELNFSSRPEFGSSEYSIYSGSGFFTAQYGAYWRFMKKVCMTKLLSTPQLDKFMYIREQEVMKLLESLMKRSRESEAVDLGVELMTMTNNMICQMAMSTRCSENADEAKMIKELVSDAFALAAKIAVGDSLGPLKMFDLFGYGKKIKSTVERYDQLVERIMMEHEEKAARKGNEVERKDIMDILLEIQNDPSAEVKLSRVDIKAFLLDIFLAGTNTSSALLQWTMAELINHQQVYRKVREEISSVIGPDRLVKESDVPNLPYLQAVIKETLRLHPSGFVIRECAQDCKISGYDIKAKTRIMVNVFAIMRDPNSWKDPNDFVPERFLGISDEKIGDHRMEIKGQNFRYLPFGSGRRGCPGASLALTVMHITVGTLVQCFDWKVKDGESVNVEIGSGFGAEMAHPLVCYPITHFIPF